MKKNNNLLKKFPEQKNYEQYGGGKSNLIKKM